MISHAPDILLDLASPDETRALADAVAPVLRPGTVLLLSGAIGAGKTHFARSVIQTLLAAAGKPPEDIPSPTFTLVQTYDAGTLEIWHADLYRLTSPDEIEELGLIDAFDTALCLVEWPDRLGDLAPEHAVQLNFTATGDDGRSLVITGAPPDLRTILQAFGSERP
ncbi:tRNA (adenosine(37)-N6)-threonylcarbamoyltransferase complex ATPase subunit type 1 TsaE [Maritimibacter sp. DP1N21-5]|uniref:tRNA (adenosine(37)-N6)-threonylcarbamoyltransferase complex ATPase subunit type 1 TsaE n=1 Tax=Maritimibacter sp. DP1N21-5 TaxID=2836867 RepID=UPI001C439E35|nr:tRNA (adenosine(37)-N6)-threonylcarbamoyltransferase complex ATPase subunit type 1 TsaE [Maritimibacter sp. DP1N21-5]MBV7410981.1 tRNA (adenosine(37)-N6)-threonylcarbamoyltransferase complex ATPase subunit type 1 TsaE [Maritimibacter sp. DP1N21-5]